MRYERRVLWQNLTSLAWVTQFLHIINHGGPDARDAIDLDDILGLIRVQMEHGEDVYYPKGRRPREDEHVLKSASLFFVTPSEKRLLTGTAMIVPTNSI